MLSIVSSDNDWDLVKSSDKKVQKKGYKYASESEARDQGQFYEKIILESKCGGESVCECVELHNGKQMILSFPPG